MFADVAFVNLWSTACPKMSAETEESLLSLQEAIISKLRQDSLGAEFLVNIFWSAMNSFRHDSILRPFPPMFVEENSEEEGEGKKDIEALRQVLDSMPPLSQITKGKRSLSTQQAQLLSWIINPKKFSVHSRGSHALSSLLEKGDFKSTSLSKKPSYIFELDYTEEAESKFCSITGDHGVMYAFHGSNVENFHSIVHNGLLNMFNKVSAFGEGTYLSTELGVCLNWSPSGPLWPGSTFAHSASCVAMCEVVKHPSVMSRYQVGGEPSLQQKVPEKYFIVLNDELIRIKYVLLFEMEPRVVRNRSWIYQHKFVVILIVYLIFLVCIGATQSKQFRKICRRLYNYMT